MMKVSRKGFTLVELIVVIAIIAILAAAVFVALDPARRLHESRNSRRWSDVATILDAVRKYQVDNDGTHYSTVAAMQTGTAYVVGTDASGCNTGCGAVPASSGACVDLSGIGSNYLASVPYDPSSGTGGGNFTDYYMIVDSNGAVTVASCDPEGEGAGGNGNAPTITVTR